MILPDEFKTKLGALVATLSVDDETRQKWQDDLKSEDVPKDSLLDIMLTIKSTQDQAVIDELLDRVELEPELQSYFDDASAEIKAGSQDVKASLDTAKTQVNDLSAELDRIKNEFNIIDDKEDQAEDDNQPQNPLPINN